MHRTEPVVKNPRISSYQVPAQTWILAGLIAVASLALRFVQNNLLHQMLQLVLFVVFAINAFQFLIPFVSPNTVLGGAKIKAAVLAVVTLIGLTTLH